MAKVIGESGAWREIAENLGRCGLNVRHPNDVENLLAHLRATYKTSVDRKKLEIAHDVASEEKRIVDLHAEKGVWRSFLNWFRIRSCKMSIAQLHSEERHYVANLAANILRLDTVRESAELVGARTEVDVIASLARLPDEYTVFSDIRLSAERYIHFNGAPLRSAQIDHLVLTPAGVFVIETKRWSLKFVESGDYHDPFDQTQRAAYLCYDQLRRQFGKIRVRSIIACAGQLPSAPKDSHVKVLAVPELIGYISWFKQPELAPDRLLQVRRYLERFVTA